MTQQAVHYHITAYDPHAHLWAVTLSIAKPSKEQIVGLPVWIPGSYMVREFSKHLQNLSATQQGKRLKIVQLDKCTWQVQCKSGLPLELRYEVYAFDNSVRTAWLDAQRGFFNPTSLCLRVQGQESQAHSLSLDTSKSIALSGVFTTASLQNSLQKSSFPNYTFTNYDELADTPFEIGKPWCGSFTVRGVAHEFVVSGAPAAFDGSRLLADTQKIVQAQMQFWHGDAGKPPFERYVFMLHAVDDGYGGLEHRNSCALICARRDLPHVNMRQASEGYITLLGLISHEYFHAWNVKRLRPAELVRLDYARENYTRMLWFFEGFTSYYDDLLLRRAGLIDDAQYLRLLGKTITQVQQTPGRFVQSVAQASMDAWVKYYRQDENTPNATVSYYTKGSLVALCFDLKLRSEQSSLDVVMRTLWTSSKAQTALSAKSGSRGGITQDDFAFALQQETGRSWQKEISQWIHSAEDLPLEELLTAHGVQFVHEPAASLPMAQRLGLRVSEANASVIIKTVLRGSLAEAAGLAAGDELIAVNDWRLHKLEDLSWLAGSAKTVNLIVSRDKKIQRLKLRLPDTEQASSSVMLRPGAQAPLSAWLLG